MIRLIVSDLDGTFLQDHYTIHPDNIAAVERAVKNGVHFAVASGRSAASCSLLLEDAGMRDTDTHVIGVNGCQMLERPFGKTLALHTLAGDAARQAMNIFAEHELRACLYTENRITYTDESMLVWEEGKRNIDAHIARMRGAGTLISMGIDEARNALESEAALKAFCVFMPGQEAAFAAAREACRAIAGVTITSSWPDNFEVIPADVDKGHAVRALATRLGVAREEVLAFGDSDNDLPMLRWAGHAYAMENAQEAVLREIPNIAGHHRDGGVARVIDRLC